MTRAEAEDQAARLQEEHPERRYVARLRDDGDWEVASIVLPERQRPEKLTETVDDSRQPPADDPRTGHERRIPGAPGGLG